MIIKDNTIKFISNLLIIAIIIPTIFFSVPKKVSAVLGVEDTVEPGPVWATILGISAGSQAINTGTNVAHTTIAIKNVALEVLRQMVMVVEKRLLAEMTKSMVNWINSGFHGAPLFLQSPDSFFRDIAKYEVKSLITLTGYDPARFPFGKSMALSTINQFKQKFADNAAYSLSVATTDPVLLSNLQNNFNFGGWNGFFLNSQYQQNNYVGYQMLYTEELARRLEGTANNNAQKVAKVLDQGAGFLSPQTCPTNPKYNNGTNEFQKPTYKPDATKNPWSPPAPVYIYDVAGGRTVTNQNEITQYAINWQARDAAAKSTWNDQNDCPGGLKATTPGSVVGNQIMNAMTSSTRQTELGAALGTSMSAIFDALLNHFLDKGLSALASKINPPPPNDDFSYDGLTLGGPTDNSSNTTSDFWNNPDELVILDEFKKEINDGIKNTIDEIGIMNNSTEISNPGITQVISQTWPRIRQLDMCLPGPDIGWQIRLSNETTRNSKKLQDTINSDDGDRSAKAQIIYNDLQYSVNAFSNWLINKIAKGLPNSPIYQNEVNQISDLYQQSDEINAQEQSKKEVLTRLEAIKTSLDNFTNQPTNGSNEEKNLVSLWKKYKDTKAFVSNSTTIEQTKATLFTAKTKLQNLNKLITQCQTERNTARLGSAGSDAEINLFCNDPLKGGYPHETFTKNVTGANYTVTHPDIPLVNGYDILNLSIFTSVKTYRAVNIQLSCNIIYNANVIDYKRNLPGDSSNIIDLPPPNTSDATDTSIDTTITTPGTTTMPISGSCTFQGNSVPNISSQQACESVGATWTPATQGGTGGGVAF